MQLRPKSNYETVTLEINGHKIKTERAQTPDQRALGLGERDTLATNHGMLFDFPTSGKHGIWMKGMRFPLDIIWLKEGVVIDLATNVPVAEPGSLNLDIYSPQADADKVLEVNAGTIERLKLKVGDKIKIP